MNLIFLTIFSIIGCYHDIKQDDSGDTAQIVPVPSGGSSTVYCYVEDEIPTIPNNKMNQTYRGGEVMPTKEIK